MSRHQKKHLFFVNGPVPTDEQYEEADQLNGLVCFRNALQITPEEGCEQFDFVHGEVPAQYARKAIAMERGEAMIDTPLSDLVPAGTTVDNGDGTTTTTSSWKPNVSA